MPNKLEEYFFDTFRIRPYYKYLLIDTTSRYHNEKIFNKTDFIDFVKNGKDYLLLKVIKHYPEITSDILLKLICIALQQYCTYYRNINTENIKKKTLRILLRHKNYLKEIYTHKGSHNSFVKKVRAVFKEGE